MPPSSHQELPQQRRGGRPRRLSVSFAPTDHVFLVSSLGRRERWEMQRGGWVDRDEDYEAMWHTQAEYKLMKSNVKRAVKTLRSGGCGEFPTNKQNDRPASGDEGAERSSLSRPCPPRCPCRRGIEHLAVAREYRRHKSEKERTIRAVMDEQDRQRQEEAMATAMQHMRDGSSNDDDPRHTSSLLELEATYQEKIRRVYRASSERARDEARRLGLLDAEDALLARRAECALNSSSVELNSGMADRRGEQNQREQQQAVAERLLTLLIRPPILPCAATTTPSSSEENLALPSQPYTSSSQSMTCPVLVKSPSFAQAQLHKA